MKRYEPYKAFEKSWNASAMAAKMHVILLLGTVLLYVAICFIILAGAIGQKGVNIEHVLAFMVDYSWCSLTNTCSQEQDQAMIQLCHVTKTIGKYCSFILLLYPVSILYLRRQTRKMEADKHLRGARLVEPEKLALSLRKEESSLNIGGLPIPIECEIRHWFVVGRPGVGKTVLLRSVVEQLRERGEKAIVYDTKGDYLSCFYNPDTDIIFNPLDERCIGWSLFNEIKTGIDIEAISHSLIPPAVAIQDPFWNDAARSVFAGILHYLRTNSMTGNRDIWHAVTAPVADISEQIRSVPGGLAGYKYIEDASSKQAMSVMAVLMQYASTFQYLQNVSGDFSVSSWIEDDDRKGFLFVTSYADLRDTLRPILSLLVDLMGRRLLSMPDNLTRRVFFILDEFGTLQRLSTIVQLLTLSRSKGGSVWLGIQDVGQIDQIYQDKLRQSIINACGNDIFFSVADDKTAELLSNIIGDQEIREIKENISMGPSTFRDGMSINEDIRQRKLILPSEIQKIPDLSAYIRLSGYDWTRIKMQYKDYPKVAEPLILRGGL